jgi:hypothetical protein
MLRQVFAVALTCVLAGQAPAEQITFAFHTDGGIGIAYGQFLTQLGLSPGMPMRGTVSYDPATRGTTAPDGTVNFSAPGGMTVQVGGLTFASDPSDRLLAVWHPQRPAGVTGLPFPEFLNLAARPEDPGLFGGPAGGSYLSLDIYPRHPGTWSGSLPTNLADFRSGASLVSIRFAGPHPDFFLPALYMDGVVTGMSPLLREAPEPGTLALAAFGAGLLLFRFRNSRANRGA